MSEAGFLKSFQVRQFLKDFDKGERITILTMALKMEFDEVSPKTREALTETLNKVLKDEF